MRLVAQMVGQLDVQRPLDQPLRPRRRLRLMALLGSELFG
jgi:hypothetical protein